MPKTYKALSMTEIIKLQDERDELLTALRAARRAIRAIKRETGKWDLAREMCSKADHRATLTLIKFK